MGFPNTHIMPVLLHPMFFKVFVNGRYADNKTTFERAAIFQWIYFYDFMDLLYVDPHLVSFTKDILCRRPYSKRFPRIRKIFRPNSSLLNEQSPLFISPKNANYHSNNEMLSQTMSFNTQSSIKIFHLFNVNPCHRSVM